MTCIYLSSPRVYHRSGSFIGISFVFITGRTPRRRERLRSNSILTTTKKKKVKRNERGAKRGRFFEQRAQYKRTVCGVRCSNNERVVSSIRRRERECVHGGCKWFKTFVRFEKNVFFLKVKRSILYARTQRDIDELFQSPSRT